MSARDEVIDGLLERLTAEMRRCAVLSVDLQSMNADLWLLRRAIRRHRDACGDLRDAGAITRARDELWALVDEQ